MSWAELADKTWIEIKDYIPKKYHKKVLNKIINLKESMRMNIEKCIELIEDEEKQENQINEGKKYDNGKLRYELVKPEMLEAIAEVMTCGAEKYGDNNWQNVEIDRYYGALMRHLQSWRKGELLDGESNLHHLKHALCNVAFMLWKELNDKRQLTIKNYIG